MTVMDKEAGVTVDSPAQIALARLGAQDECCGSQPPRELVDDDGRRWMPGDCWCTLPPEHPEQLCVCEPCRNRFGAPGWRAEQ